MVLLSVTLRSSRGLGAWRWPAYRAGGGPVPRAGWAFCGVLMGFHGAVFRGCSGVSAGQDGVLAMVMTAGAMRVILSFGPAWGKALGDFDLRSRCRFRSVTTRCFAICLVRAW